MSYEIHVSRKSVESVFPLSHKVCQLAVSRVCKFYHETFKSPGNPYFLLLVSRVLPSMNFTSSQCLMHFFSFQRAFHHTQKRQILRILWSYGALSSYLFTHFLFSFQPKFFSTHGKDGFYIFPADTKLRLSGFCSTLSMTETPFNKGPL